ncbi:MAG: hypothetical protein IKT00_08935 [Prevotella sp.]|nr:hypothetical protein [Prevotella sp.]
MKKSIILSLVLLGNSLAIMACGYWGNEHNNYLFSVFRRELMNDNLYGNRVNQYWKDYTGGLVDSYHGSRYDYVKAPGEEEASYKLIYENKDKIREVARQRGDTDLLEYADQLDIYLDICDQLRETWEYPTKEQLTERRALLETMRQKASSHLKGTHKAQWALLLMRANMQLKRHKDNIEFWQKTGKNMGASVFRDMMENIYAGALSNEGRTVEACEAFAAQGDLVSVKWAMRKHRNLAGIQQYYNESHDTPLMHFLVQDFVNNVQETIDNKGDEEWMKEIDARVILQPEMDAFISFAQGVVSRGESKNPCLWQTAIGALQHLSGRSDDAFASLTQAMSMAGTGRMKDNARAIRIVASASCKYKDSNYDNWLVQELDWLAAKIREEANSPEGSDFGNMTYNHYFDILDRAVHQGLVPYYKSQGREEMAIALLTMVDHPTSSLVPVARRYEKTGGEDRNPYYSTYHFAFVDSLNADDTYRYYQWRHQGGKDALERYVISRSDIGDDFLNDLMGTKYLGEGRWNEALPYLRQVSLDFIGHQNIAWWMKHRDWTKARWFECQSCDGDDYNEGPETFTSNPKVRYCEEMQQLEKTYNNSKGEQRLQAAYDMAVRLFQSSFKGDCWHLTRYSWSCYDTAYVNRPDPSLRAIRLLEESKASTNPTLHFNSIYALAYIPIEPWYEEVWNEKEVRYDLVPRPQSRGYKALADLSRYVTAHPENNSPYIRKCDILKAFRKTTRIQ